MVYVITGATSFIGSKIVRNLINSGETVYAVCRPSSTKVDILPYDDNLRIVFSDIDDLNRLKENISKADIFINLAWKGTNHKERDDESINQTNIANTLNAMRCAKDLGCDVFVESGSQAEYGYQHDLTDETADCYPFSAYGKAKLETLNKCSELAQALKIKYIHLRIFSVYGEHDHDYTLFKTCLSRMMNDKSIDLTEGTQLWNFLYIDDAAKMIVALVEKLRKIMQAGETEIVNIASEDTRHLCEFISQMKYILNSKSKLNFGKIRLERLLSINPDISKMKSIIGNEIILHTFDEGVRLSEIRLYRQQC